MSVRRLAGGLAAAACFTALTTATATAATVSVEQTFGKDAVTYVAAPGEHNAVSMRLTKDGKDWRVSVTDPSVSPGAGCQATNAGAVCATGGKPRVDADLGDMGDSFDGTALSDGGKFADPVVIDGGEGADEITVISAYSCPDGQGGADTIKLVDFDGSIAGHGSCFVFGGEGADTITGSSRADFIDGGPGGDLVKGRDGADGIEGDTGGDTLVGGGGRDELSPGDGPDHVQGGVGDDSIEVRYPPPAQADGVDELAGGAGSDSALYLCGGCRISLDGEFNDGLQGEGDYLDVEKVTIESKDFSDEVPTVYGPGDDILEGGGAAEELRTKRGDDNLSGGGGRDVLDSGSGDDEVDAVDGQKDNVDCGPDDDKATVDPSDEVKHCETVTLAMPRASRGV